MTGVQTCALPIYSLSIANKVGRVFVTGQGIILSAEGPIKTMVFGLWLVVVCGALSFGYCLFATAGGAAIRSARPPEGRFPCVSLVCAVFLLVVSCLVCFVVVC